MTAPQATRPPLMLLGAGGHAKVVHALAIAAGWSVAGVCDPALAQAGATTWRGVPVLGGDEALERLDPTAWMLANGIGHLPGATARERVHVRTASLGWRFPALVHPFAWVDPSVCLRDGCQVMAGAVVQADAQLGENALVNTGARIDHDTVVGPHAHVAPGAVLCGDVRIGAGAFIGAGATVVQGLQVGPHAVVGAGTTLRHDLPAGERWRGPGRRGAASGGPTLYTERPR